MSYSSRKYSSSALRAVYKCSNVYLVRCYCVMAGGAFKAVLVHSVSRAIRVYVVDISSGIHSILLCFILMLVGIDSYIKVYMLN